MKQAEHRGHLIYFTVHEPSGAGGTAFWNVRGRVEFYEGTTYCSVNMTGSVNKFTSEVEAEQDFLAKAKNWIDRRVVTTDRSEGQAAMNVKNGNTRADA